MNPGTVIDVRAADNTDSEQMRLLLNEIIEIGGTTAIVSPLSDTEFGAYFLNGPTFICCYVAVNQNGEVLGFQALGRNIKLPSGWADIATFARVNPKTPGVGTALFVETIAFAQQNNIEAINATIRADNVSGLAYYSKMGFEDYAVESAVPLGNGTPIDRISKKLLV